MKSLPPPSYNQTHKEEEGQSLQVDQQQLEEGGEGGEGKEEERIARCEWDITLSSVVSSGAAAGVTSYSYAIGVTEFDVTGHLLATRGIARKIRLYSLDPSSLHVEYSDCICTPAKLSSLRWKPGSGGRVVGSGEYDGVVTEYDLETKSSVFERDEHGGRRIWSVDNSRQSSLSAVVGASASDDGSVNVWDPRCESGDSLAVVRPSGTANHPVCSVEFDPSGGWGLAAGCGDRLAYVYDTRMLASPVDILSGHTKTVTYVKFLDDRRLVSSSVDGCLMLWDLSENDSGIARPVRTYKGHVNCRNFVGLSVWRRGGLLVCGSESNQVFVYDSRWGDPIWVRGFAVGDQSSGDGFVSSVCWRQVEGEEAEEEDKCVLVAGGSDGALQVFQGKKR